MVSHDVGLVIAWHHPLAGPESSRFESSRRLWLSTARSTYWPVLHALYEAAEAGHAGGLCLAISPSWLAWSALGPALDRSESDLPTNGSNGSAASEWTDPPWRGFAESTCDGDLRVGVGLLRNRGVELLATAASEAFLPVVADHRLVARLQIGAGVRDHEAAWGRAPSGFWLPHGAYRPGLEEVLADFGLSYFTVEPRAFVRGTVQPPDGLLSPLITPAGPAAFAMDEAMPAFVADPTDRYASAPRYQEASTAGRVSVEHASHFVSRWRDRFREAGERGGSTPRMSLVGLSVHDLAGAWRSGPRWLVEVLSRLADSAGHGLHLTDPGTHLSRLGKGALGRPGTTTGGPLSVRPADSDWLSHVRLGQERVLEALEDRPRDDRLGAAMTRCLLAAQALDWDQPRGAAPPPQTRLAEARGWIDLLTRLHAARAAGAVPESWLEPLELGLPHLPELETDLDVLLGAP